MVRLAVDVFIKAAPNCHHLQKRRASGSFVLSYFKQWSPEWLWLHFFRHWRASDVLGSQSQNDTTYFFHSIYVSKHKCGLIVCPFGTFQQVTLLKFWKSFEPE